MLFSLLSLLETGSHEKNKPSCLQCGQCCTSFGGHLRASAHDLKRWAEHGRQDLLAGANRLGWIWIDPDSGERVEPCPHIDRSDPEHARCRIYEERPDMCRDYPTLAHGKRCLRGVFLSCWVTLCVEIVPECAVITESLALAA